jgi:hypothetical protein
MEYVFVYEGLPSPEQLFDCEVMQEHAVLENHATHMHDDRLSVRNLYGAHTDGNLCLVPRRRLLAADARSDMRAYVRLWRGITTRHGTVWAWVYV